MSSSGFAVGEVISQETQNNSSLGEGCTFYMKIGGNQVLILMLFMILVVLFYFKLLDKIIKFLKF